MSLYSLKHEIDSRCLNVLIVLVFAKYLLANQSNHLTRLPDLSQSYKYGILV